jgi:hypothetical protein
MEWAIAFAIDRAAFDARCEWWCSGGEKSDERDAGV